MNQRINSDLCLEMEYVNGIRDIVSDTFLTLPLLIIGFIFFMGALTSNTGLLYLFFGHLFVVPALGFMANQSGPAWYDGDKFSLAKLAKWIISCGLVAFVNTGALGGGSYYSFIALLFIPFIGQFIARKMNNDKSVFYFVNPVAWFTSPNTDLEKRASPTCSMVPNTSEEEDLYSTPSSWLAHIVFLFGFFFMNASAIYNLPVPALTDPTDDQQTKLNTRVSNRKWLSSAAIIISISVLLLLLFFRYMKTPCEGRFLYSLVPLIIIGFTGAAWFQIIFKWCGIRPPEVLGIVQGMISPSMIDNNIVCVGTPGDTVKTTTTS